MLNRRSFLKIISTLSLPFFLNSCSKTSPDNLNILFLKGSIPFQLIGLFNQGIASNIKFNFKQEESLESIFNILSNPAQEYGGDLFTLGNFWLKEAIDKNLLKPFSTENINQWRNLSPQLKKLIKVEGKDDHKNSPIWGLPYRWGNTVIAYRRDLLEKENILPPTDWPDLWKEEFKNQIGLLNQPREIIGLTLKKLGYSYNTLDLAEVINLKSELIKLNEQAKFYSSNYYLQPLILGDVWITVGWSEDIFSVKKLYPNIEVIIPSSGTSLWTEMWVQPKNNPSLNPQKIDFINQWLNFCWKAQSASQISLFTSATSPIISILNPDQIPPDILNNPLLNINPDILAKSEFINHLPPESEQQYLKLWQEVVS
jgi:putative spermidine/putrescine transport system substrate-binding protein